MEIIDDVSYYSNDCSIISALRRTITSNIKTLSFHVLNIELNDALLTDEILASRLGLLPLRRNSELVTTCNASLDITNNTNDLLYVYSGDIVFENDDVSMVDKKVPLTVLDIGGSLKFRVKGALGTGNEHAKWNPVTGIKGITNDDITYTLSFETNGSMTHKEIYNEAIDNIIEMLEKYL